MVPSDVPSADRVAIGQAATAFVDAWNAHDSHAFALTFVPDGDFTMCSACTCTGDQPSTPYRLITPVTAAVDIDWQMTGAV